MYATHLHSIDKDWKYSLTCMWIGSVPHGPTRKRLRSKDSLKLLYRFFKSSLTSVNITNCYKRLPEANHLEACNFPLYV